MSFNILKNAVIRNSTFCRHDTNEGYSVVWDTDDDFKNYTVFEGVTARIASNNTYFMVTLSGSGYITSTSDVVSLDAGAYTQVKVSMRVDPGPEHTVPTRGRLDFRTSDDVEWETDKSLEFSVVADNAYRDYVLDFSTNIEWQGTVVRFRLYPMLDGDGGQKVHLKSIRAVSPSVFSCSTLFNPPVCDKFTDYSYPCPWAGTGGSSTGVSLSPYLRIEQGVNDKLLVCRDIERKLGLVGVGGYAHALCDPVDQCIRIQSGTRVASSSVVVSAAAFGSAALTLGFLDAAGSSVATEALGTEAASRYEPEGSFRLSQDALDEFTSGEDVSDSVFTIDPFRWVTQGGYSGYDTVDRATTISFFGKTVIDYNNPITENGVLVKAAFSGAANIASEFRIYRQKLDGTVSYVAGASFGSLTDNNQDKLFEVDCSIRVQKGDLVGLYDVAVHTGRDFENPNFSYYQITGNLTGTSDPLPLLGEGDLGLPVFCRGRIKTDKAAIIMSFDLPQPIEFLEVSATEEVVTEVVPLTSLLGGGLGGGPQVTGTTGYGLDGEKAPGWTGLAAITDGDKLDVNGISDSAFPLWYGSAGSDNYDYTEASVVIDFAPGINVLFNIYRVVVYFAESSNIKHFSLDYPENSDLYGTSRTWRVVADRHSEVYIDGALSPTTRYFYDNPSEVTSVDYHEDYVVLKYRYIDFRFDDIQARAIRYRGFLERDAEASDYNSESLALFPIYVNPKIQEIEVFAKSTPEENLGDNFEVQTSVDGVAYLTHPDKDLLSSTDVRFTIGYPASYVKLLINPTSSLGIKNLKALASRTASLISTNVSDGVHSVAAPINNPSSVTEVLTVTNNTDETSNYYIDILDEDNKPEGVILWNKLGSDTELQNSEYGPGGILYKRPNFSISVTNVAYSAPAFILDPNFWSNSQCYVSYDSMSSWEAIGNLIVNGNALDGLSSESASYQQYGRVYAAVNVAAAYDFEEVVLVNQTFSMYDYGWDATVYYSPLDVDSPALIPDVSWTVSSDNARWLRLSVAAVAPGSPFRKTLAYISAILDVTSQRNYARLPWVAESRFTDGSSSGSWRVAGEARYFCVDLQNKFDISGVVLGPSTCGDALDDPGYLTLCNDLDSNGSNVDIAFSGTQTSDPTRVRWSAFGAPASGRDGWVLVRGSSVSEIAVFINDSSLGRPLSETARWWSSRTAAVYIEDEDYCSVFGSPAIDYPANNESRFEYMQVNTPFGYDNDLYPRDALSICLYISDLSQIDSAYGYFKLGRATTETFTFSTQPTVIDEDNFFVWDFEDIVGSLTSGFNFVVLPFTNEHKVGSPRFTYNLSGSILTTKKRARMTNFKFQFKGVENNSAFTVRVDNLEILRSNYPEAEYGNGLYLAGADYTKFPLNGFNHNSGCIEFFLDPDWSKDVNCNSCTDLTTHTIFRFLNSYGYSVSFFMSTSGVRVFVSDGSSTLTHVDDSIVPIVSGERNHLAFVWDFSATSGSIFEIYIGGILSSEYPRESLQGSLDLDSFTGTFLLLGGKAWSGFTTKDVGGLEGVVDNIKVYNYPKRDFSDSLTQENFKIIKKSRDLLLLSLDDITFYGYEDRGFGLPLLVRNVAPGSTFNFYVRSRDLFGTQDGEVNRSTFIEVIRSNAG